MKAILTVTYQGKSYSSNEKEFSEDQYNFLEEYIQSIAEGKANYLCIESKNQDHYFGQSALKESVITITKKQ